MRLFGRCGTGRDRRGELVRCDRNSDLSPAAVHPSFSFASDGTLTLETPQGTFPGFWDDTTVRGVTTVFFAVNFNGNVFVGSATEINGQIAGSANIPLLGATVTFSGEVVEAGV